MTFQEIPLNKLKLSPANMRQGDVDCGDLVASFSAPQGTILHNLRVTVETANGKPTGFYLVHVGGRRWRAANQMVELKRWKKTHAMPCVICADERAALEESVAENMQRLEPSAAERFKAFKALNDQGTSPAEIADRFGISELIVRRRLKLAVVSPRLFELFERNEIDLEQMHALTLSDSHEEQEAAYFGLPESSRWAHAIRSQLTKAEIPTDAFVCTFVGLDAYTAAGGAVRQDLFARVDGSGFVDRALMERLAIEKLEEAATPVRAEGWKWVEAHVSIDYQFRDACSRVYPVASTATLSVAEQEQLDELEADLQAAEVDKDYDATEALQARIDELRSACGPAAFTPEQMAIAGAVVTIERGQLVITRGFVKPGADTKALKALQRTADKDGAGDSVGEVAASAPRNRADGYSAALVENLTAHRTLALRATLMNSPRVALAATVQQLLILALYKKPYGATALTSVALVCGEPQMNVMGFGEGLADTPAAKAIEDKRAELLALLPESEDDLWDFLVSQDTETLSMLLAFAVSQRVFAVDQGSSYSRERVRASNDLARAVDLDMADFWEPDAAFFARIPKAEVVGAMGEGAGVGVTPALEKLKKAELAEQAAAALQGKRWIPDVLRTPPLPSRTQGSDNSIRDETDEAA